MKPVSLQTYTLRDAMEKDLVGTMKAVAGIGFKGVEVGGLYGKTPAEMARLIADLGLAVSSNHGPLPTRENVNEIVDAQKALGSGHLVSGFGPDQMKTVDACKACAEKFALAAELLCPHGISFSFHNHFWEFARVEDGRTPYEIIMAAAPGVMSQLDLYWVAYGGADPVAVLGQYGSRIELVHVKDGLLGGQYHFKALGTGQVDLPAAIRAVDSATAQWLIVEQDQSDGDMMADVKTSYAYLVSNGLAAGNR